MTRGRVIAVVAVVGVFLVAIYLGSTVTFPPDIPIDRDHPRGQPSEQCMTCHGPDGSSPRSKNHPLVDTCFQCHSWPEAAGRSG